MYCEIKRAENARYIPAQNYLLFCSPSMCKNYKIFRNVRYLVCMCVQGAFSLVWKPKKKKKLANSFGKQGYLEDIDTKVRKYQNTEEYFKCRASLFVFLTKYY
jgi:hypothetical protein